MTATYNTAQTFIDLEVPGWIFENLPAIQEAIIQESFEYGDFRGGASVGFKDRYGNVWVVSFQIRKNSPSQSDEDVQYHHYAGMKLATALENEFDTQLRQDHLLPFMAVDQGGVVVYSKQHGLWIGISYSGLTKGEEDKKIALAVLEKFLPTE